MSSLLYIFVNRYLSCTRLLTIYRSGREIEAEAAQLALLNMYGHIMCTTEMDLYRSLIDTANREQFLT